MIDLGILLQQLALGDSAREDVFSVMERKDRAFEFLMRRLMGEVGLDDASTEKRLLPIVLQQTLIHLADDLADGDCDYLENPEAAGPTTQYTLQQLVSLSMLDASICPEAARCFCQQMLKVGSAQHEEIRTRQWTFARTRAAAVQLGGWLYGAYFALALHQTSMAAEAEDLGYHFGLACFVARDIKSSDVRYTSLSEEDRQALRKCATASADRVYSAGRDFLNRHLLFAYGALR